MKYELVARLQEWWRQLFPAKPDAAVVVAAPQRRPLVVNRPSTLEQRYELLQQDDVADQVFKRLQQNVYAALDQGRSMSSPTPTVFREAGRLAPARPYFYIKPQDKVGWLIERSGAGWVVSRAEKIVDRNLFLRQGEPLDTVALYRAKDREGFPRVRSPLWGGDLLSFAVYEQKLLDRLGLS